MSATLTMHIPAKEQPLPTELKRAFEVGYANSLAWPIHLSGESLGDLGFVRGLKAAGIDGADELRIALDKYGAVELHLRW